MSPDRMLRVALDRALEDEIAEYYWECMEPHVWPGNKWYESVATYHVYLRFGVKVKWEELMYIVYH